MVRRRRRENHHYSSAPRASRHYRSSAAGEKNNKNKSLFCSSVHAVMAAGDGEQLIWRRIIRLIKPRF